MWAAGQSCPHLLTFSAVAAVKLWGRKSLVVPRRYCWRHGLVNPSDSKVDGKKVVGKTSILFTPRSFSASQQLKLWSRELLVVPRRYAGATGLSTHPIVKSVGTQVVGRTSILFTPRSFSAITVKLWGRKSLVVPRRCMLAPRA